MLGKMKLNEKLNSELINLLVNTQGINNPN